MSTSSIAPPTHFSDHRKGGKCILCFDDDPRPRPAGFSKWSLQHLQWALHDAALTGARSRDGGRDAIFFDVDYSSEVGRAKLPDPCTVHSVKTVRVSTVYDSDKPVSPLSPFNNTHSSILALIRAAVVSRRNSEVAVTLHLRFAALVRRPEPAADDAGGDADGKGKAKRGTAAEHKRHRPADDY